MTIDANEFKQLQTEMSEAVNLIREKSEKFGTDSAEYKAALESVDAKMTEFDNANQELVEAQATDRKNAEELKERIVTLEGELASGTKSGEKGNYKDTPEYKALQMFAKAGVDGLDQEQKQLLRGDDSTQGGYLTMPEMDNMIIREITEISPVRRFSRVKRVGSKTLMIPRRTRIPVARFEGEAAEDNDDNSNYGSETLTVYAQSVTIPFTRDIMMDSQFDLETEIRQDVSEAFAFGEGNAFVLGTGAKQPEGILSHSDLTTAFNATTNPVGFRQSETAGQVTFDDLKRMTGDLKTGYNPMYFFNRRTKADLLTKKGSDGHYLWTMNVDGAPAMISGYSYALFEDMPDVATDAFAIGFGDLMRGYCITDFTGMEIVRDEVTRKRNRIIELTFFRWLTGQVILSEAIKLLRIQ